jgi:repressor of nif and glnA expression
MKISQDERNVLLVLSGGDPVKRAWIEQELFFSGDPIDYKALGRVLQDLKMMELIEFKGRCAGWQITDLGEAILDETAPQN